MEEQETIITQNRADNTVSVYTSNTHDIRYFKKTAAFTLVQEWFDAETGEVEAASFTLPAERANIRKIVKSSRPPMSDAQKATLAAARERAQNS